MHWAFSLSPSPSFQESHHFHSIASSRSVQSFYIHFLAIQSSFIMSMLQNHFKIFLLYWPLISVFNLHTFSTYIFLTPSLSCIITCTLRYDIPLTFMFLLVYTIHIIRWQKHAINSYFYFFTTPWNRQQTTHYYFSISICPSQIFSISSYLISILWKYRNSHVHATFHVKDMNLQSVFLLNTD